MTDPAPGPDLTRRLLQERARLLARPPAAAAAGESLTLLVLIVGGERYGVEIGCVEEVQPRAVVTPVPGLPAFWAGLANVRGQLYPVLDLARYLGLPAAASESAGRLLLVSSAEMVLALLVADVTEVAEVTQSELGPPLGAEGAHRRPDLIRGVTRGLLAVLNMPALLSDTKLVVQDTLA